MTVLPERVATRPRRLWLGPLRAALSLASSLVLGAGGPYALALLALVLVPSCTYSAPTPPLLVALAGCALVCAGVVPAAVAGVRLWWVGVPAAALAVHGMLPIAWSLITEPQSGFCF